MAVLKIVPKLYQEKISEKLKEEISLVTTGEAKYYNRLYKFFQYTDIQCTADINYETRKMYMDSLEKEDISEKYKAELLSLSFKNRKYAGCLFTRKALLCRTGVF